jgi:hypothetical protein
MGLHPRFWSILVCMFIVSLGVAYIRPLFAAPMIQGYVRFDRMKATTASSVRIFFQTSATNGTEAKLKLTFSDGTSQTSGDSYTVNATQAVSSASCATESGATALPGTLTAAGDNTASSKDIIISGLSDLATSTTYCVDLTTSNAVTNPAAGGYTLKLATQTSGDADIDTKYIGSRVISDDQIVVTAVVPPTFDFVLSGNTDSFTTLLDSASVNNTTGRTVTITTNAAKGWITWVKSANQGLSSASAPYTIASGAYTEDNTVDTITAGTEGYVLDVNLSTDPGTDGGTVTVDGDYNGAAAGEGGRLNSTFRPIASSNGTSDGSVLTLIEKATIRGSTPAANDYTDTLTVVGAGNF